MADRVRMVGMNHVALEVDDLEQALDFYGSVFEFELRGRSGNMAFLDMGDQFLALAETEPSPPDTERHFGLVVDDLEATRDRLKQVGAELIPGRGLDFRDPSGNRIQVVQYSRIQFSKLDAVLEAMGAGDLEKDESALQELRDKGVEL